MNQAASTASAERAVDRSYLELRAEQELKLAQKAKDERAVSIHYKLACRYLDLLYPECPDESAEPADKAREATAASKQSRH